MAAVLIITLYTIHKWCADCNGFNYFMYMSLLIIDIRDLDIVIKELTSTQHLSCTVWHRLGLQLGLYEPTLVDIEADHRGISANCFRACMAAWLRGEDKVKDKDGPSWLSLVLALETLEINSIATNIKQKYC